MEQPAAVRAAPSDSDSIAASARSFSRRSVTESVHSHRLVTAFKNFNLTLKYLSY